MGWNMAAKQIAVAYDIMAAMAHTPAIFLSMKKNTAAATSKSPTTTINDIITEYIAALVAFAEGSSIGCPFKGWVELLRFLLY
jgi:hypothetical protein